MVTGLTSLLDLKDWLSLEAFAFQRQPYGYDFIGEQTVKNIAKPVGAYRVQLDPRVTVSGKPEKLARSKRMPIFAGAVVVLVLAVAVGIWQFYLRRPSVEPASVEKMAHPAPSICGACLSRKNGTSFAGKTLNRGIALQQHEW
jgi:hypothetical protein